MAYRTKSELWKYRNAKREYERLLAKIEEIETQITNVSIDYSKERVKTSLVHHDALADVIDKLTALRNAAIVQADVMVNKMAKAYGMIEKVKDPLHREILQRRYIQGEEWESICVSMGYAWAQIHRLHKEALEELGGAKGNG